MDVVLQIHLEISSVLHKMEAPCQGKKKLHCGAKKFFSGYVPWSRDIVGTDVQGIK